LNGEKGPHTDIVLVNAAAALMAAGAAASFKEGISRAEEAIASGAALRKLEALREFCGKG